jgi:hypothetical protein
MGHMIGHVQYKRSTFVCEICPRTGPNQTALSFSTKAHAEAHNTKTGHDILELRTTAVLWSKRHRRAEPRNSKPKDRR